MSYAGKRLECLRAAMVRRGYDFFYVRGTSNIQWLTAFDGVFDSEDAHALIVSRDEAILHTDSRYAEAAQRAADATLITVDVCSGSHAKALLEVVGRKIERGKSSYKVALESSISLGEYRILERELQDAKSVMAFEVSFEETYGLIVGLRATKDSEEIRRMRAAQSITDAAFSHIITFLRPGMTEREVQIELEDYMIRHGADGLAFSSIVASGAQGALPHAIPGDSIIEAGQCIVFDFGARYASYCSDMTRTVFVGEPDQKLRHAYEALREANETIESFLRPGVTGAQAQERAESVLAKAGYGGAMGHSLGHGVGLDVHEEPVLAPRNTQELIVGNVVTVEPGIYISGEFGMRLEDYGVIVEDGFEVFTQSSHDMVII